MLLYLHAYLKGLKKRVKTGMQLIITAADIFYVQYAQFATKEALAKWSKTAPAQKMTASVQLPNTITKRYQLSKRGALNQPQKLV